MADVIGSEAVTHAFERWFVRLAAASFLAHVGLIFAHRRWPEFPLVSHLVTDHYLSAIATPFNLLLFFEVYLLVLAVPRSLTLSMGKQYELMSLIVIRDVFKEISHLPELTATGTPVGAFLPVFWDMGGGLVMFLLVAVYYRLSGARGHAERIYPSLRCFIDLKKTTTLLLGLVLVGLALRGFTTWGADLWAQAGGAGPPQPLALPPFYPSFFTVMVFADIFLLIASVLHSDRYELIFRNAGFVISTLLIRFTFTVERPYNVVFGGVAILFGVLVLWIHGLYGGRLAATKEGGSP